MTNNTTIIHNSQLSLPSFVVCVIISAVLIVFLGYTLMLMLSHKRKLVAAQLYFFIFCVTYLVWLTALIVMFFVPDDDYVSLKLLDSVTHVGNLSPISMFLICMTFITEEKMSKAWNWLYSFGIVSNILCWTNDWHHWVYVCFKNGKPFSINRQQIELGWYSYFEGVASYILLGLAAVLIIVYAIKKKTRIVWMQSIPLIVGFSVPLAVNFFATLFPSLGFTIAATPISYSAELICCYFSIFKFHLLDIVPYAQKKILDIIPDGYMILDSDLEIKECNNAYRKKLSDFFKLYKGDNISLDKLSERYPAATLNLINKIKNCANQDSKQIYEQSASISDESSGESSTYYFFVEISRIYFNEETPGVIVLFRDITSFKKQLTINRKNETLLIEQERLAMLGQMVGGMAHNLKTPIMGISGATASIEELIDEERDSLGDPDVTIEDYKEIHSEMLEWLAKIREQCHFMNEIIVAVKGQATNAIKDEKRYFLIDEFISCSELLMKHELKTNKISIRHENIYQDKLKLYGDMNNLIQVVNNMISNSIFVEKNTDEKEIILRVEQTDGKVVITVRDHGPGISPDVQRKLFKEMVTSKGAKGNGIGLYVSNTIVKSKFGGEMWYKDAPGGGAIVGMTLPLENETESVDVK